MTLSPSSMIRCRRSTEGRMAPHDEPNAATEPTTESTRSPWLTAREVAKRAGCGINFVYAAVRRGQLRAARLNVRGDLRIHESWVDAWITSLTGVVNPDAPCTDQQSPAPFVRRK